MVRLIQRYLIKTSLAFVQIRQCCESVKHSLKVVFIKNNSIQADVLHEKSNESKITTQLADSVWFCTTQNSVISVVIFQLQLYFSVSVIILKLLLLCTVTVIVNIHKSYRQRTKMLQ